MGQSKIDVHACERPKGHIWDPVFCGGFDIVPHPDISGVGLRVNEFKSGHFKCRVCGLKRILPFSRAESNDRPPHVDVMPKGPLYWRRNRKDRR